jgi:alanine racemase
VREIVVDLDAIVRNYRAFKARTSAQVCAVVKANAYGHGMHEVAQALDHAGVDALAVADLNEALELRAAGIQSRIICWLLSPVDDFELAAQSDVELGVSTFEVLEKALEVGAKIHIKVDTGLSRNGFSQSDWGALFERLAGREIFGLFSHLSNTSEADDLTQLEHFERATEMAAGHSVTILQRHLAATGGFIDYPQMHFDMVRIGIGIYGLNPFEDRAVDWLSPAMSVTAELINQKRINKGQGVSYGYRFVADRDTNVGLVPFGYSEGMPRISVGHEVAIAGNRYPVIGRIAMDQFLIDLGEDEYPLGTKVEIFGSTVACEELAVSAQTINYEIVTRIGGRANRVYIQR